MRIIFPFCICRCQEAERGAVVERIERFSYGTGNREFESWIWSTSSVQQGSIRQKREMNGLRRSYSV